MDPKPGPGLNDVDTDMHFSPFKTLRNSLVIHWRKFQPPSPPLKGAYWIIQLFQSTIKFFIYPIVRQQYWTFLFVSYKVIALPMRQQQLSLLLALKGDSENKNYLSFSLLNAIAIYVLLLLSIAFKNVKERQLLLSQQLEER